MVILRLTKREEMNSLRHPVLKTWECLGGREWNRTTDLSGDKSPSTLTLSYPPLG